MNPEVKRHFEATEQQLLAEIAALLATPDTNVKFLNLQMQEAMLDRVRAAWGRCVARYEAIRALAKEVA